MGFNVVNFVDGYALGSEEVGNLKPLQVTENGIYYPADYKCSGFNQVEVKVLNQNIQLDMLPTLGEVIIDKDYTIKIKLSDEIEEDNTYDISNSYSDIPYLSHLAKYWSFYFCVYKNNRLVFGNTSGRTYVSHDWSWTMWNSNIPWLNHYHGFTIPRLLSLTAEKVGDNSGLSGVSIQVVYQYGTFNYYYDINGDVESEEIHDVSGNDNTGAVIRCTTSNISFFADKDWNIRAQEMIAYGLAANNIKELECKIYTA